MTRLWPEPVRAVRGRRDHGVKPTDSRAKSPPIECLTKVEADPYFVRDFGIWKSPLITGDIQCLVTWTKTTRDRQTEQATARRLHWQTGPEQADISAVTIQTMEAPTDEMA